MRVVPAQHARHEVEQSRGWRPVNRIANQAMITATNAAVSRRNSTT
jgi:hypothetical protein